MTFSNPWLDFEDRRSEVNRHGENTPRLAVAWADFKTTGWGEKSFEKCYNFDLTFAERPFVAHGYYVIKNKDPDIDEVLWDGRFPRAWGGVYQWRQNSRGFYTGAWVFTVVESASPFIPTTYPDPEYVIQHHFTFQGLGIKDLPDYQLDEPPTDEAEPE
jgi:hypothetical protein